MQWLFSSTLSVFTLFTKKNVQIVSARDCLNALTSLRIVAIAFHVWSSANVFPIELNLIVTVNVDSNGAGRSRHSFLLIWQRSFQIKWWERLAEVFEHEIRFLTRSRSGDSRVRWRCCESEVVACFVLKLFVSWFIFVSDQRCQNDKNNHSERGSWANGN